MAEPQTAPPKPTRTPRKPRPRPASITRAKVQPFNPDLFGSIVTEPPALFPYKPARGDKLPFPPTPDPTGAAERALAFLATFKIPEGRRAGKPIAGEDLPPYIERAIRGIIGHRDPATQTRYIRQAFFCAPRKNMKTYLAALISILFLYGKQEQNGEILVAATGQKQARRCFDLTLTILKSNQEQLLKLRVQDSIAKITHINNGTTMQAVPADPAKLFGLSPSLLILDELHAWKGVKGRKLLDSLITGMGARANPLTVITTTVPDDRPKEGEVFLDVLRAALKVRDGESDDRRHLPMIWMTDDRTDTHDVDVWKAANPGWGYSVMEADMREDYAQALESGGLAGFKAMRLNSIPKGRLAAGWFTPKALGRITSEDRVALVDLRDADRVAVGLDYGGGYDLASFVVVGISGGHMSAIQRSFLSATGYEVIRKAYPAVEEMVERGELTLCGEEAVESDTFVSELVDVAHYVGADEVAVDPAMMTHLAPQLKSAGFELVECRQGMMSMSAPMTLLEEKISTGDFDIGNDTLFLWTLGNVAQITSSIGRRPTKIGSDSGENPNKIDPVSALLTALQLIQEGLNEDAGGGGGDAVEWVDPYVDPVDARAVLRGGVSSASMLEWNPPASPFGGWITHG